MNPILFTIAQLPGAYLLACLILALIVVSIGVGVSVWLASVVAPGMRLVFVAIGMLPGAFLADRAVLKLRPDPRIWRAIAAGVAVAYPLLWTVLLASAGTAHGSEL